MSKGAHRIDVAPCLVLQIWFVSFTFSVFAWQHFLRFRCWKSLCLHPWFHGWLWRLPTRLAIQEEGAPCARTSMSAMVDLSLQVGRWGARWTRLPCCTPVLNTHFSKFRAQPQCLWDWCNEPPRRHLCGCCHFQRGLGFCFLSLVKLRWYNLWWQLSSLHFFQFHDSQL